MSEEELTEFFDRRLVEPRRSEVARAVAEDPELTHKIDRYKAHGEGLHALYDDILLEPVPDRLVAAVHKATASAAPRASLPYWRYAAAIAGLLFVGSASGWFLRGEMSDQAALLRPVLKQAVLAHRMLQIAAGERQESLGEKPDTFVVSTESNPFDVPLRAPATAGNSNFVPVSYQSAVGALGPTVQLVYRDKGGNQVTLFVQAHSAGKGVPFETTVEEDRNLLYWIDGPLVYVLVGEGGETQLVDLANSFYGAAGVQPATPAQQISVPE